MRGYLATLGILAAGGVLGLVASARSWGSATVPSSFTTTTTTVTGNDLAPLVSAAPLVALAAVILVPAVRGLGRRVVGAVLALLGGVTATVTVVVAADLSGRVRRWIGSGPDHTDPVQEISTSPVWAYATAFAAVLVLVAGIAVALRGPSWPGMGSRYERPDRRRPRSGPARRTGAAPAGADEERAPSSAETWDALDRGDDPTA